MMAPAINKKDLPEAKKVKKGKKQKEEKPQEEEKKPEVRSVSEILDDAINLHLEKSEEYGADTFLRHGKVMDALFPEGITLKGPDAFNLFNAYELIVGKLNRIAATMEKTPHLDSFNDLVVYGAIATNVAEAIKAYQESLVKSGTSDPVSHISV